MLLRGWIMGWSPSRRTSNRPPRIWAGSWKSIPNIHSQSGRCLARTSRSLTNSLAPAAELPGATPQVSAAPTGLVDATAQRTQRSLIRTNVREEAGGTPLAPDLPTIFQCNYINYSVSVPKSVSVER